MKEEFVNKFRTKLSISPRVGPSCDPIPPHDTSERIIIMWLSKYIRNCTVNPGSNQN